MAVLRRRIRDMEPLVTYEGKYFSSISVAVGANTAAVVPMAQSEGLAYENTRLMCLLIVSYCYLRVA